MRKAAIRVILHREVRDVVRAAGSLKHIGRYTLLLSRHVSSKADYDIHTIQELSLANNGIMNTVTLYLVQTLRTGYSVCAIKKRDGATGRCNYRD
jgi:hypothetical protein